MNLLEVRENSIEKDNWTTLREIHINKAIGSLIGICEIVGPRGSISIRDDFSARVKYELNDLAIRYRDKDITEGYLRRRLMNLSISLEKFKRDYAHIIYPKLRKNARITKSKPVGKKRAKRK